ncbi:ABC transporter permease [Actinospica durhamensis]|uniref:ABC transporter permease n=1 Tax=Actinospica durhamensis TaxID=1508375 RepID=A0A941IRD1_9ACTN|nr:ABC transporter permease [Actinospica durhamensis]MBR7837224.1 ABC transporter permease [Actinospica durhamensis]
MTVFLFRRLLSALAVLLALSILVYGLFYLMPGDPAELACGKRCDVSELAQVRHAMGLDRSIVAQFWTFISSLFVGHSYDTGVGTTWCSAPCLGFSFQSNEPVTQMLLDRLPVDLSLALGSAVLWLALGIGFGLFAALRPNGLRDRMTTLVAMTFSATPLFVLALLLLIVFCVWWQVLPFPTYVPLTQDPGQWFENLLLPWLAIALVTAGNYLRLTRAGVLESLGQDHIRTLRAYGYSERRVVLRHAVRGALPTLATMAAVDIGGVLAGAVFTESMFGLPGLGKLMVDSANNVDLPVVTGITLLAAFLIIAANAVADVLYAVLDPRVRLA